MAQLIIEANAAPVDLYVEESITSGTPIQVQNKSTIYPMYLFAGAAAPSDNNDYFRVEPGNWSEYQGTVCMVWSGHRVPVVVGLP